jgi:hypothetical protein
VRARDLLSRAVTSGNADAGYYLADLLIGDTDPARREPQRALDLVNDVYAFKNDDPTTLEIRAAAFSQLGKFTDAARVQHNALNKAKSLGWDTAPQMQRLEMYRRQEAWTQRLLIY